MLSSGHHVLNMNTLLQKMKGIRTMGHNTDLSRLQGHNISFKTFVINTQ